MVAHVVSNSIKASANEALASQILLIEIDWNVEDEFHGA
jgi:hypothetical protein